MGADEREVNPAEGESGFQHGGKRLGSSLRSQSLCGELIEFCKVCNLLIMVWEAYSKYARVKVECEASANKSDTRVVVGLTFIRCKKKNRGLES